MALQSLAGEVEVDQYGPAGGGMIHQVSNWLCATDPLLLFPWVIVVDLFVRSIDDQDADVAYVVGVAVPHLGGRARNPGDQGRGIHRGAWWPPIQARTATAKGDAAAVSAHHGGKEECLAGCTLLCQADACLAQLVVLRIILGVVLEGEKASCEALAGWRWGDINQTTT